MAKKKLPTTSAGFDKALAKMQKEGINTRQQAADYAILMLESIKFEMRKLEETPSSPLRDGLLERYNILRGRWERALDYTTKHLFDPIGG